MLPDPPTRAGGPAPQARQGGVVTAVVVAVTVVALLAVGLTVLKLTARPFAYLIGDSITFDATDALHRELDATYVLAIDGRPGFRVDQLVDAARAGTEAGRPSRAVINLGTNDVNMSWPPDRTHEAFDQLAGIFDGMCVTVVTINELMPDPGAQARAVELNRWLKPWAAARGFRVVDWAATVRSRIGNADPATRLLTDGIHPTDVGAAELASAYAAALATC